MCHLNCYECYALYNVKDYAYSLLYCYFNVKCLQASGPDPHNPNVPPSARVKEFPNEEVTVNSVVRLFKACRETHSVKRSTLANHIKSAKHNECKKKLKTKQGKEIEISTALKKYDESVNPKGQTLLDEQRVYRVKVMTTF